MVVSSVKDSLKLMLSDVYKISDSDYSRLSDILISKGVKDIAFDGGLVALIMVLCNSNYELPISITYLNELWDTDKSILSYNIVNTLSNLVKSGIVRIRKVRSDVYFSSNIITRGGVEADQDKYVVMYGTDKFNSIFSSFKSVLTGKRKEFSIMESLNVAPKKVYDFVNKTNKLLSSIGVEVEIESYMKDNSTKEEEINLLVKGVSDYSFKDNVIQRKAKSIIKLPYVIKVESYKESKSELFIGLTLDSQGSYSRLHNVVYDFLHTYELGEF